MVSTDRVRAVSQDRINRQIDQQARDRIQQHEYSSEADLSQRIEELDREWDIERILAVNASVLSLTGLALSGVQSRKWLLIPSVVLPFLLQHAIQGWCPPLPILRRLGIRTRKEIDQEKYALKALRGDFGYLTTSPSESGRAAAKMEVKS